MDVTVEVVSEENISVTVTEETTTVQAQQVQGPQGVQGEQGPQGEQGLAGADGTNGTNGADGANGADGKTVLNGVGAPSNGLGVDGDFYINTATSQIYGPKTAGAWGSPTSLVGPTGATGPGVPTGGVEGQVLRKLSATNYDLGFIYDTGWQIDTSGFMRNSANSQDNSKMNISWQRYRRREGYLIWHFHFEFNGAFGSSGGSVFAKLPSWGSQLEIDTARLPNTTNEGNNQRAFFGVGQFFQVGTGWKTIGWSYAGTSLVGSDQIRYIRPYEIPGTFLDTHCVSGAGFKAFALEIPIVGWT